MKQIKIIFGLIFITLEAISQTPDCIKISSKTNEIQIDFTLPQYQIIDTSLVVPYSINKTYQYLRVNDNFGVINDIGNPEIPQISFDIAVPDDATNFKIVLSKAEFEHISTNKRILPAQDYYENENNPEFIINEDYYNSSGELYNFNSKISENYRVFGQKGIAITIFPFLYNPSQNNIKVLKKGTFVFSYSASTSIYSKNINNDHATQNYLSNFFVNYINNKPEKTIHYGRYLIITAPNYENTLTYFANYKRNIGYDVVVVNTNETGSSAFDVKNYLQNQYNNSSTRPTFVLLVGDITDISNSGGSTHSNFDDDDIDDDFTHPITDIHYARLDDDDYFADIFIGRWSISSINELQNIINKTIIMETQMHTYDKQAVFLSGSGDGADVFDDPHRLNVTYSFEPLNWSCNELYAIDGATRADGLNALNDDNLFFMYRGHGNYTSIGSPFDIRRVHVDAAINTIYPGF